MSRVIIAFLVIGMYVYALVDLARSPREEVRNLPKTVWALLIVVLGVFGIAAWMLFGRPRAGYEPPGGSEGPGDMRGPGRGPGPRPGGPAPDDDPEFLRRLEEQAWSRRMEQMRRERQAHREPQHDEGDQGEQDRA